MRKLSLLLLIIAFFTGHAFAQGTIKGNIKTRLVQEGKETIAPLVGAEVYVKYGGTLVKTLTNDHGDYTLKPLEPGTYSVTINSILIDTITVYDINVSGKQIAFVNDLLVPLGRQMKKVVITPNVSLKDESPSKEELKGVELEKLPDPKNINTVIALMGGGAWVSENGRQISFRGARIGDALYIIDGVRQSSTNVSLPSGSIATINAWYGGVPAEYGDFMGGVVVIETMSYFDWENQQEVKALIKKKEAQMDRILEEQNQEEEKDL